MVATAGWYPDPAGLYESRFWDGSTWTSQVRQQGIEMTDPVEVRGARPGPVPQQPAQPQVPIGAGASPGTPPPPSPVVPDRRPPPPGAAAAAGESAGLSVTEKRAVVRAFLTDKAALFPRDVLARLLAEVEHWEPGRRPAPVGIPAALPPPPTPGPAPARAPAGPGTLPPPPGRGAPTWQRLEGPTGIPTQPAPPATPRPVPRPRPASAMSRWWAERRRAVSADLAVHGLAYLGVALLFTGVFGFVVFAFGEVGTNWRPVAELVLPLVFFGTAAFLHRRGAPFVSAAMEFLGGLVLPVVAVAAMADGAAAPPDLTGAPLVAVLVLISLVLAASYALVVRRRPTSPLRFLVAPMVWLAVASLGLAFAPTIPGGRDVSHPFPIQWALVAVAVAATLGWCRLRPDSTLASPTTVAAIPGAALAEVVTLLAAPRLDWPVFPLLLAGAASLVSIELLAPRLRPLLTTTLQALTIGITAAALAPQLGTAWAGAAAAIGLVALAEWQAWRRPHQPMLVGLLSASAVLALIALERPWPTLAVAGVGLAWSAGRRIRPLAGLPDAVSNAGLLVFPVLAASAVVRLLPFDTSLVVLGAAVALVAIVVRLTPARRHPVMTVLILAGAGAVATAAATDIYGRPWLEASAAGLAALALLLAPRWPCLRVWTTAAATAVALAWVAAGADLSLETGAVAATALATVLVVAAVVRRTAVTGHVGLVGHVAAAAALAASLANANDWPAGLWTGPTTASLGLVTLGWAVTTGVGEAWGCSVRDLFIRLANGKPGDVVEFSPIAEDQPGRSGAGIPPLVALLAATALVPALLASSGALDRSDPWLAVAASAVPLVAALAARALAGPRHRLARVWSIGGVWLTVVLALAASPGRWSAVAGWTPVILAVVAVGPVLRRAWMNWLAWIASAAVVFQAARVLGLPGDSLHLALFAWASAALVGSLALDDVMCGRREAGQGVRRPELKPGAVLGAIVAPLALLPVYGRDPSTYGWWSLAAAAVAFVVALQLRRGLISTIAWALSAVAYAALMPWKPMTLPWTLVPIVAVLLVVADLANRLLPVPTPVPGAVPAPPPDLPPPPPGAATPRPGPSPADLRWDLPPFLVAHGVAFVALLRALDQGWVPATWIATGALALVVGARLRAWPWAAGGTGLVLVGAGVAGPAWLTLALAVTAAAASFAATRSSRPQRTTLQVVGMLAAGGAWCSAVWWQAWNVEHTTVATALASAAVVAVLAVSTRWAGLGRDWLAAWVALPLVGIVTALLSLENPDVPRSPAGVAVAGALAALALGAALVAAPAAQPWLREASAFVAIVAAGILAFATEASATAIVAVAVIGSVASTVIALTLHVTERAKVWLQPAVLLAGLASGSALVVAAGELPQRPLLVAALLATGVELLGLGLVTRRVEWLMASPAAFATAWMVFASEALTGNPQWFTVPIGLTVLVMVALGRWDRRRAGGNPADPVLVGLDLIGMAFVVGSSLVQTVSDSPAYGLLAAGLGVGLVVFGVLSRVRRRLAFGVTTIVAALVLMVLPPLAELVPAIHGWVVWALLGAVGMLAILTAAFLEQGRRAVRQAVRRFAELTQGWE